MVLQLDALKANEIEDYYRAHSKQDEKGLTCLDQKTPLGTFLGIVERIRKELRG